MTSMTKSVSSKGEVRVQLHPAVQEYTVEDYEDSDEEDSEAIDVAPASPSMSTTLNSSSSLSSQMLGGIRNNCNDAEEAEPPSKGKMYSLAVIPAEGAEAEVRVESTGSRARLSVPQGQDRLLGSVSSEAAMSDAGSEGSVELSGSDGEPDFGADEAEMEEAMMHRETLEEQAAHSVLVRALDAHPLFRGCQEAFLAGLVARSERRYIAPGAILKWEGEDCLFVVDRGALRVRVGQTAAHPVNFGPGEILNGTGFLMLTPEVENFKPKRSSVLEQKDTAVFADKRVSQALGYYSESSGSSVHTHKHLAETELPEAFRHRRHPADPVPKQKDALVGAHRTMTVSELVFFSLCPYGAVTRQLWTRAGCLPLKVVGGFRGAAAAGRTSITTNDGRIITTGNARPAGGVVVDDSRGACIMVIPALPALIGRGASNARGHHSAVAGRLGLPHLEESAELIEQNSTACQTRWRFLMDVFNRFVLPGAPAEIIWAVTEHAEDFTVEAGEVITREGVLEEDLIIVAEGMASVERRTSPTDIEVIGRLRAGSIIGDLSLIGAMTPRPATVRAKTTVDAVRVPAAGLLQVLDRYPGVLKGCEARLRETAEFIQDYLPSGTEVVHSLSMFSSFSMSFVSDIARSGVRQVHLLGVAVVQEGTAGGTLFVLEHGRCNVEVAAKGKVAVVPTGNCFGERTLLGSSRANATVRVCTPFAIFLQISQRVLRDVLERNPDERPKYEQLKKVPSEGRIKGSRLRNVELFRFCGQPFLEVLSASTKTRCYLPGQSIVIQGDIEEDVRMCILVGGRLVAERNGQQVAVLPHGATVGELAFLGRAQQRAVTIRAASLAIMLEIPRSAFAAALQEFPQEEETFRRGLGAGGGTGAATHTNWPFLQGWDTRFSFMVDLHAERLCLAPGDLQRWNKPPTAQAAVLILAGEAAVVTDEGEDQEILTVGGCFNAQMLIGAGSRQGVRLDPRTECEVRLLTLGHMDKVLAEFPEERDNFERSVMEFMAEDAEKRLGHKPKGAGVLRLGSAFLAAASEELVLRARELARPQLYRPGEKIAGRELRETHDDQGEYMFFVLDGTATITNHGETTRVHPCGAFGEPTMLAVAWAYPGRFVAESLCLVLKLGRTELQTLLTDFPADSALLAALRKQAKDVDFQRVRQMLAKSPRFRNAPQAVISSLCPSPAEVVVFAPGATISPAGEACKLGTTSFHLLLGGQVQVEGAVRTVLAELQKGDTFGEMGAFGLTSGRTGALRAWKDGLVACARISGVNVAEAVRVFPQVRDELHAVFTAQEADNKQAEGSRRHWLENVAVPALARTKLLSGCPETFLFDIAVQLQEAVYPQGSTIAVGGSPASSMFVLLGGTADLHGTSGMRMGRLTAGGTIGEVGALGLFPHWIATVKAASTVRLLEVTDATLQGPLDTKGAADLAGGLRALVEGRREQVARGAPLALLDWLGADPHEASVRAVALLAECVQLSPGEIWECAPDDNPCGAFFGFVIKGRAKVEMAGESKDIMPLSPGSFLSEGLAAEFGARIRADTAVEAYRVRRSEFELAVASDPGAQRWVWHFRMKEKEVYERLRTRLCNAQGLLRTSVPHARDREIHTWTIQRCQSAEKAFRLREKRSGPPQKEKGHKNEPPEGFVPLQVQSGRTPGRVPRRTVIRELPASHVEAGRGLLCYAAVKLPLIAGKGPLERTSSAPQLPVSPARVFL